ncbi:MAG: hypothetical protein IPL73_10790 [Candidatus Obscuribacter sp.]|nr:hypothetical protein [Candidatus Obscuribacter sp.]
MSAIEALRTITAQAIGAAQVVMTDKRKQLFGDAMRQLTVDVSAGRSHSVAMSLRPEFDYEAGRGKCLHPDKLTGVAALVYQDCQVFSPTLEYWSKVVGDQREPWTEEGFNIVCTGAISTTCLVASLRSRMMILLLRSERLSNLLKAQLLKRPRMSSVSSIQGQCLKL